MIIRVEPRDWSMFTVLLYFDPKSPDGEDEPVRSYLADHRLQPRREFKAQVEERELDVLTFGGCYLGRQHVQAIVDIQTTVVQKELLADEVLKLLRSGPDHKARESVASMAEGLLQEKINGLVTEYHRDSSVFLVDSEGQARVVLDATEVQERFLNLLPR